MDGGMRWGKGIAVIRAIVEESRRRNLQFLAGSLAFYAFVSLVPLLLLVLVATTLFAGETIASYLLALTRLYLSPAGEDLIATTLTEATGWVGSSLIGLVVLVWAALRMFLSLDVAFAAIYGTDPGETPLRERIRDGLLVVTAIVVAIVGAIATAAAFTLVPEIRYLTVLDPLLLVCGLFAVFFPLYYVLPDADVTPQEVLPGAVFAAVGWALLQVLFRVYVSMSVITAVFGVISGTVLFLLWLYFGAHILLVGVVLNVVLADRTPDG
ncbi:YihY/virulence factor BrkB family protein [Halalkalicoccus subterraneus]|uniref:YihY/virulence factor BrkB family protein n=1 Tax=Halalkalicoccus subterraneus TaxID=2675002 RepID=UPI001FE62758|nr:YihY/virulence factor BrkB family protein [Halalkalicoccus subterraneus]